MNRNKVILWGAVAIILATVSLILYDLSAAIWIGNDATISWAILVASEKFRYFSIILSFSFGVLFGHLLLPQHVKDS